MTFLGGEVNLAKSLRKLKNGQFVVAVSGSNSWIGVRKIAHKWWCHIRTYRITVWLGKCDALDAVHLYLGVYPGVDKWRWGIYVQDGEGIFIFSCVFSERYGLFMSSLHQDVKACCMLKSWRSALFKLKPSFWSLGYLALESRNHKRTSAKANCNFSSFSWHESTSFDHPTLPEAKRSNQRAPFRMELSSWFNPLETRRTPRI